MLPSSVRAATAGTAAGAAKAYATTPARPDTPWSLSSDMQNLSLGIGSILQTLTEGSMSIYWLMALHAIDTQNTALVEKMQTVLVKGYYTNFFFAADTVVGLAVADTLQPPLCAKLPAKVHGLHLLCRHYRPGGAAGSRRVHCIPQRTPQRALVRVPGLMWSFLLCVCVCVCVGKSSFVV